MRILVVNWQDRKNPEAGGAEVHLHEIFGRLAGRGHEVHVLVCGWAGAPAAERVDGMQVHRVGRRNTFPLHARRTFHLRLASLAPQVIVEDINKLPLFTPLWSDTPVVGIVPHLFGTTAFRQAALPVASLVWLAERMMPRAYRGVPLEVISESTAEDLVTRGFTRDQIQVSYPGVDHQVYHVGKGRSRYLEPTVAYVGRLKRYKGLEVVLRALALLRDRGRRIRLLIAGRGDDRPRLEALVRLLRIEDQVEFLGFVSEREKVEILQRIWGNLYPSPKEGWGITNVEAAACGTASIASDSPGLRESVVDGVTGFLVPHRDAEAWMAALDLLTRDVALRDRLGENAIAHARRFTWEATARETEDILTQACSPGR